MKLYIKSLLILAFVVSIVSCSEDYLETNPTEVLSEGRISEIAQIDPSIGEATLNGAYALFAQAGTGESGGNQEDFGQKTYDIILDLLSQDMAQKSDAYTRHNQISRLIALQDESNRYNSWAWTHYYKLIFAANTLISQYGGNDATPETEEAKAILGQAKALRAYAYYYVVNMYAGSFDASQDVAPLYTSVTAAEPLSTQGAIYTVIEKDLRDAISLLENFDRGTNKLAIDKTVAKAVLSYALAAQGKNGEAYTYAKEVIDTGEFTLMQGGQLTGGFNNVNEPYVMFGTDLIESMGFILNSWWGFMDVFSFSYAWAGNHKVIDDGLFDSMDASDKRRAQFISSDFDFSNSNASIDNHYLLPGGKFYDIDQIVGGSTAPHTGDYIYMRIAEMYLLGAEAAAKSNNDVGARELLKALVSLRVDDASYVDGLSGQALKDEIIKQTRLELWGEGKSFFAMKRNQESRTRGTNHKYLAGETVSYDDSRLVFSIPIAEKQNNPFIN